MTKTATHYGHCQLCGREQKLPGGKLSLHGYAVQWNQFVGTCPGSDHFPYEQAKNLLAGALEDTRGTLVFLRGQAKLVRAATDEVWFHEYHKAERSRGRNIPSWYEWVRYPVSAVSENGTLYTNREGKETRHAVYGHQYTRESLVTAANATRADAFLREAESLQHYADWLVERIAQWKPDQPLRPVVAEVETPVDIKVIYVPNHWGHKFKLTAGPDALIGRYFVSERAAENAARKALA